MPDFTYCLTRVCLRTGQLTLPLTMQGVFPEGTVRALDTASGEEFELQVLGPRFVAGLGPFFKQHGLEVNDLLLIRPLEDGRFALTPTPKPRRADYTRPEAVRELVDRVVELAPLSEREIRGLFPDLPEGFDLGAALREDGRLSKYEGRWGFLAEEGDAPRTQPTVTSYPSRPAEAGASLNSEGAPSDVSLHARARTALETFGFRVEARGYGQLLAHADLGRRHYTALVHLLAQEARLDWTKLLARRRDSGATYLAVFGDHHDLLRLASPAAQAHATLWSWQGLGRALELLEAVPMSPFDLEPHFARDGLFEAGLSRFERAVDKRVSERGEFSLVLSRLATMRAPSVFLLDDVIVDAQLPRDRVLGILELLSEAPFHLVSRVDSGEFCLRQGVQGSLQHLSHYALSLVDRLPARRTERVRGNAAAVAFEAEESGDE